MCKESQPRILVVDNLVDAADSMAMVLQLWGYDTEVCYDGATALKTASEYRPQVVLLDLGMPHMDGFQVVEHLRDKCAFADTIIIAITGHTDANYRNRARLVGFDHYLLKPVDLNDLQALLGHATAVSNSIAEPEHAARQRGVVSRAVALDATYR